MDNIPERVASLEQRVESIDHRLFGNGDAGELSKMQEKVDKLTSTMTSINLETQLAIASIRRDMSKYIGYLGGAMAMAMFLTGNGTVSLEKILHVLASKP